MHAERPSHLRKDVNCRTDLTSLDTPKVTHPDSGFAGQVFLGQLPCPPQPPYISSDPFAPIPSA